MEHADKSLKSIPSKGNQVALVSGSGPEQIEHYGLVDLLLAAVCILKARRKQFLLIASLIFIGVVAASYVRSPRYETSAKLMVQLDMQTVALSQADVRYNLAMKMADEAVGTQVELLRSSALIENVIDQLGENILAGKPRTGIMALVMGAVDGIKKFGTDTLITLGLVDQTSPRQALAQTIADGLKILPARKSQMIDISLRLKNREATQQILAALIDQHLKKLSEMEAASQAYQVYSGQAAQLKSDLEKAEQAVAAFKLKHGFVDLASEKTTLLQNADRLKSMLDGIQGGEAVSSGTSETTGANEGGTGSNDLARLVSRVNELRLERTKRAAMYAPGHVKLDEVQEQLAAAEQLLGNKVKWVREAAAGYLARSKALDGIQPEFNRLLREAAVREDNYKAYIKASEDRRLASAKDRRVMLTVIDPPPLPEGAVPPTRLMIVLGGLLGSLLLAAIWVLFANWWRSRIHSLEEWQSTRFIQIE